MNAHPRGALVAILALILVPPGAGAVDVTGKWYFEIGGPLTIVPLTQLMMSHRCMLDTARRIC